MSCSEDLYQHNITEDVAKYVLTLMQVKWNWGHLNK